MNIHFLGVLRAQFIHRSHPNGSCSQSSPHAPESSCSCSPTQQMSFHYYTSLSLRYTYYANARPWNTISPTLYTTDILSLRGFLAATLHLPYCTLLQSNNVKAAINLKKIKQNYLHSDFTSHTKQFGFLYENGILLLNK